MEYCKLGELFDYIVKYKRLSEDESANFFYQLINGVEYIHSQGIAHRDLKPENLLLTEDKTLKIIDFGLSHEFEEEEFLKTKCGSPSYAAPEIISKPNYNGFKIDIWCCGIILYAMLCGYLPFDGDDDAENNNVKLFQNILECEPELPDFLSNISKNLIMCILNPDPDRRITIEQIKKHPFYLKGKRLCKIDYTLKEEEIRKTRESFYKNVKDDNKNNNYDESLKETDNNYLNKNKSESANKKSKKNYKENKTDGNIKSNEKNSIDVLSNNKYKLTINAESRNNNKNLASIDNVSKATKAKLQLLSLKPKNKQKNELNSFKRRFNPINLLIKKKLIQKFQTY
jgi:5'-AMP-activated protein kinase catalytic alpha subunit